MATHDREGPGNYKWLLGSVIDRLGKTLHDLNPKAKPEAVLVSIDIQVAQLEELATVYTDQDAKFKEDLDEIESDWRELVAHRAQHGDKPTLYDQIRRRLAREGAIVRSLGREGVILSRGPGQAAWPGEEDEAEVMA